MSRLGPRTLLAGLGAVALCVPLAAAGTAAASPGPNGRGAVGHVRPPWATPSRAVGTVDPSTRLSVRVSLAPQDPAAVEAFAASVSDPASPDYGHYLSPSAYAARFGPDASAASRVTGFLQGQGLDVSAPAAGRQWVQASGSVAQLNQAFGTTLKKYSFDGRTLRAPADDVTVPTAVASDITTVTGLTTPQLRAPRSQKIVPDTSAQGTSRGDAPGATRPPASDCSNFWGEHQQTVPEVDGQTRVNTYECGLTPAQLRNVYGTTGAVRSGNDGRGQTVAIIDAYANPTMESDANRYSASMGEPGFTSGQYTETVFRPFSLQDECGGEDGWNGEEALDVEAVHAMAPGANIHYVGARNCDTGIDEAVNDVITHHTADIVSNSYGFTGEAVDPSEIALEHNMFLQAVSEGIGFYFSSGDDGDNVALDGLTPQPDYPASDPAVTAVGGTSELIGRNDQSVGTLGWETSLDRIDYSGPTAAYTLPLPGEFIGGAGGGRSTIFAQPSYQRGTVPGALSNDRGQQDRVSPDVAADADPYTGFYVGYTGQGPAYAEGSIGGTSLACPLIAGIQAVAQQGRRTPIGFANPLLYSLKKQAFNDVTPQKRPLHFASALGNYTGTFETGDSQTTRPGYDDITGRGTPNGATFLAGERR
ncbi:S53 family peptidase [Nocardioides korecus]